MPVEDVMEGGGKVGIRGARCMAAYTCILGAHIMSNVRVNALEAFRSLQRTNERLFLLI